MPESVVLLHGFGGTHRAWDGVDRAARPLNATGRWRSTSRPRRGRAAQPPDHASPAASQHVLDARARSASRCAATRWAGASRCTSRSPRPSASRGWCSIARTAGIEDAAERAERRARRRAARRASSKRARSRSSSSAGAASRCSPRTRRRSASSRAPTSAATDPRALAAALRGIGTGEMEPLWERLGELHDAGRACSPASATRSSARSARRMADAAAAARELTRRWRGGHALPLREPGGACAARSLAAPRTARRRGPGADGHGDRARRAPAAGPRGPRTARASPGRSAAAARARRAPRPRARAAAMPSGPSSVEAR